MALSKNEFFKNMLVKVVQNTGLVNDVANKEQMKAFVRASKIDAATSVSNWNNIVYPSFKTLRSGPEHEYDVLDSQYGGISGWTVTTEPWATENSTECFWDFTRGQPHSIAGTILCLSAQIESLREDSVEFSEYDDTEIKALVQCVDLNMAQLKKDLLAECYNFDCDGSSNLTYSLGRHIHEIFSQLVAGAPSTGLEGCFTDSYPTLSIETRVSSLIYDALIPASSIEYCGSGNLLTTALQKIHDFVGQSSCSESSPTYSTQTVTGPSLGNHVVGDGDSLVAAIKQIDRDLHSIKSVNLSAGTGSTSGLATVLANKPNDSMDWIAGSKIRLTGGVKQVEVAVEDINLNDLVNVNAPTPSDDDILRYDSGTNTWVSEADTASGFGNVSVYLRPVDFDQRSSESSLVSGTQITPTFEPDGITLIETPENDGVSSPHTTTEHFRNSILRKTFEMIAGTSGAGMPTDRWYAHNVAQFNFVQSMSEEDQISYATFPMPRTPNGFGGWNYPNTMSITGYFFAQAENPGDLLLWSNFAENKFSFSITSHQDPSGAAGSILPFVDGAQMTQLDFNASTDPSGYSAKASKHVNVDYRVCVLDFDPLTINTAVDMNGFITLKLAPVNGVGFFNRVSPSLVWMLGLRVDFS